MSFVKPGTQNGSNRPVSSAILQDLSDLGAKPLKELEVLQEEDCDEMVAQFDPKSGTVNLVSSKRKMQELLPKDALVGDESIYVTDRATIDDPTESETIKVHPNYSDAGQGILQVFKNYAVG